MRKSKKQGLHLHIFCNGCGQYYGVVSSIATGSEFMRVAGCFSPEEVVEVCEDHRLVLASVVYPSEPSPKRFNDDLLDIFWLSLSPYLLLLFLAFVFDLSSIELTRCLVIIGASSATFVFAWFVFSFQRGRS